MAELRFVKEKPLDVFLDPEAASGIRRIWAKVEQDIFDTTGTSCVKRKPGEISSQAVIVTCAGCGEFAEALEKRLPELSALHEKWESYGFYLVDKPLDGVEQGLVIMGSDKLGTIYGMFHLSELLGVTAWGFWGDITPPVYGGAVLSSGEMDWEGERQEETAATVRVSVSEESKETVQAVQVSGAGSEKEKEAQAAQASTSREADQERRGPKLVRRIENGLSKEPSVRYRGFFINDEWPCFGAWTTSHYQGFTAEMYEHVFEYLLRMKGNYLWPAMWSSSFLLDGPGLASMELATEYGIYIGMSHHEPCMRSGNEFSIFKGENSIYGNDWSYTKNKDGLLRFWEDGLRRVKGQQIFPTVGMRGEADSKLLGDNATIQENVRQLKEIITCQRELISREIDPDLTNVPQLFAVYKEVEDYYFGDGTAAGIRGFEELEDVTLMFCEDNFGNMRALPQQEERLHPGGFGMYYHVDYHGSPISYEWVNSSPISKMWEQMTEAFEYGIRTVWILNVGDVKFNEYPLGYFMALAYDFDIWGSGKADQIAVYTREWIRSLFGDRVTEEQLADIVWVLEESVRLAGYRRPECLNDRVYHPAHFGEGRRMLARAEAVERKNEELMAALEGTPAEPGYFSTVYFAAAGIANLLKLQLLAGRNHLYASQGLALANWYGDRMLECIEKDKALAGRMAAFRDGKWSGMELESHIGFVNWNDEDWRYPVIHTVILPGKPRLCVSRADGTENYTNQYFPIPLEIDDFLYPGTEYVTLLVSNGGKGTVKWRIEEPCEYLEFSAREGETALSDEVEIRVCWEKVPLETLLTFEGYVHTATEKVPLRIRVQKRDLSRIPENVFPAFGGLCVMDAADAWKTLPRDAAAANRELHSRESMSAAREMNSRESTSAARKMLPGNGAAFGRIPDYGKYGSGMKVFPSTAAFGKEDWENGRAPALCYRVWAEREEAYWLILHTSPANPLIYGGTLRLGVSVNGQAPQELPMIRESYRGGDPECEEWCEAVLNQEHTAGLQVRLREGVNEIQIYAGDAGLVLERLVLCVESRELPESYFGPERTLRI